MLTDISLLKPHPINDKIYSNQSCEDLEASISLNGLLEPLVITKENTVISGHRRLMACKNLNMKKVDVRVCDYDDGGLLGKSNNGVNVLYDMKH